MLPVLWIVSAIIVVTAAVRSRRHPSALRSGRLGVGFLYVVAGAAVNASMLATGDDYGEFATGSYSRFVRDTWESVVVPNHHVWIGLLILFELTVGVLSLVGGRCTQFAYALAIAFHVCLLSFGWGFFAWAIPMIIALATLLRAERRQARDDDPAGPHRGERTAARPTVLDRYPDDPSACSSPPVPFRASDRRAQQSTR